MKEEIPMSEKSTEDAKHGTKKTRAEKKAFEKVKRNVEKGKPGPSTEHIDSAPDTDPANE